MSDNITGRPIAERGWIGVDLDGTLAEYHGWPKDGGIGKPILPMLERVKSWVHRMLYHDDMAVRIMTARVCTNGRRDPAECEYQMGLIKAWCREHIGVELPVVFEKDFRMVVLYDDRCEQVEFNTGRLISERIRELEAQLTEAKGVAAVCVNAFKSYQMFADGQIGEGVFESVITSAEKDLARGADWLKEYTDTLIEQLAKARKDLDREERDHIGTINSRDAHEERLNEIFSALGMDEEESTWSSCNDPGEIAAERASELYAKSERQAAAIQAGVEALEFAVLHTETSGYDYAMPHVAKRCQEAIVQLKPCLDGVQFETWTDEQGTEWNRPTAWAYAKACKALHKHADNAAHLAEALKEIMALDFAKDEKGRDDFYSGAPRFVSAWLKADAALAKLREAQGA